MRERGGALPRSKMSGSRVPAWRVYVLCSRWVKAEGSAWGGAAKMIGEGHPNFKGRKDPHLSLVERERP